MIAATSLANGAVGDQFQQMRGKGLRGRSAQHGHHAGINVVEDLLDGCRPPALHGLQ